MVPFTPPARPGRGARRSLRPLEPPPTWRERLRAIRHLPRLIRLVWDTHPIYTAAIVALRIVRAVVPLGVLWIGKLIIDAVVGLVTGTPGGQGPGLHPSLELFGLVGIEFGIAGAGEVLARLSALYESLLGDVVANRTSVELMQHAASLDLAQLEDADTYDKLERARRQTVGRIGLMTGLLATVQDLVTLVTLAGALAVYVPWLLLLLAVAVVPLFLGETRFAALSYSLLYSWTQERRQLDYLRYIGASDLSAKEVKLFQLSPFLVERYASLAEAFYRANRALSTRRALAASGLAIVGSLGYYGAYAAIIYLTVTGHRSPAGPFTLGVLTFLAASFRQSRDLIQRSLLALTQLFEQSLYLDDLFSFLALRPAVVSPNGAPPVPVPIRRGFVFDDVGFRYPGADRWAVRHLSFELHPGERLALVGENGAGKTTLVKLLARLYDPTEGRILLDGRDLRDYDLESLRRRIGVIFQDFVRYDFPLRENIAVGDIARLGDQAAIEQAARRSLAHTVAERLPHGYDQMLGKRFEGGVDLSGGEWQKVALARAYLREADVLILDEPTASLDARAEYEVFQRFAELSGGKMTVLISHRFSTVRMADRILVLHGGEVVESGTHEALVNRKGLYAELFALQAQGYR
ncbi:MAG TPA: ABC transporter ATP-binding protein [Gemmatimonadales bacterium]|jgi:ATP-binding cassette subfamily B protein|nr:ABC transporter ATP-binding protein [Gemmatimonadales bacterium]